MTYDVFPTHSQKARMCGAPGHLASLKMEFMGEANTPPVQPNLLDFLSRVSAFSAVAVFMLYIIGFIVTSLHYATFGIPQSNPFKTQVLAAGLWSVALIGGPIVLAYRTRPHISTLGDTLRASVWNYALVWLLVSVGGSAFSFEQAERFWPSGAIGPILLIALLLLKRFKRWARYYTWQAVIAASLLYGWLVYLADKPLSAATVAFWLTIWGQLATFIIGNMIGTSSKEYTFLIAVGIFIAVLGGFAATLYPRILYSWGGGKPVPILMRLSQTSDILPGQQLRTDLIEQSSEGYYVIDRAYKKAVLIPNSAVSWVYYGDKPFDP